MRFVVVWAISMRSEREVGVQINRTVYPFSVILPNYWAGRLYWLAIDQRE